MAKGWGILSGFRVSKGCKVRDMVGVVFEQERHQTTTGDEQCLCSNGAAEKEKSI